MWAIAEALRVELHLDLCDPAPLGVPEIPSPPSPTA
jgi:hypothetical protein